MRKKNLKKLALDRSWIGTWIKTDCLCCGLWKYDDEMVMNLAMSILKIIALMQRYSPRQRVRMRNDPDFDYGTLRRY